MKSILSSFRQIGLLTTALTLALAANFAYGQWANPPATPPNQNIAAPINTGTGAQVKDGGLSVDSLTVFGRGYIESTAPTIEFSDTNNNDFWLHANSNVMYLLADRNDDGSWSGESPWPFRVYAGATPAQDYLAVSNDVRAVRYCDENGLNCFRASDVETAAALTYSWSTGSWGACSGACGTTGTQSRTVTCRSSAGGTVSNSNCSGPTPATSQSCSTAACPDPSGWYPAPNQACTTACSGQGLIADNRCWSGENKLSGTPNGITFPWGMWGGYGSTGIQRTDNMCYKTGQVQDNDGTDITVACYCGTNPSPIYTRTSAPVYSPPQEVSCYIAGTDVTMADGTIKDIEDVEIGEFVLGENGEANEVKGFHRPMLGGRLLYSFNGGPYFVTAEHPFKTTEGWKSINKDAMYAEDAGLAAELELGQLEIGDEILRDDGTTVVIESIDSRAEANQQLYDFNLGGNHTYYVDGFQTHNSNH